MAFARFILQVAAESGPHDIRAIQPGIDMANIRIGDRAVVGGEGRDSPPPRCLMKRRVIVRAAREPGIFRVELEFPRGGDWALVHDVGESWLKRV